MSWICTLYGCTSGTGLVLVLFFFQAEDGIRDLTVTGVQTCALPICRRSNKRSGADHRSRRSAGGGLRFGDPGRFSERGGIGRAAGRERGEISVGAGSFKKKKIKIVQLVRVCTINTCRGTIGHAMSRK